MKIYTNIFILVLACNLFVCAFSVSAYAVLKSNSEKNLDLSSGYLSGTKAVYYLNIPWAWQGSVTADRETPADNTGALETVSFYCTSVTGKYKPALMFTLHIFPVKNWTDNLPCKITASNDDYIAAVEFPVSGGFRGKIDQNVYNEVMAYCSGAAKISDLIKLTGKEPARKIYVKDKGIAQTPEIINGDIYVPLRTVATALGYSVEWLPQLSKVEILNSDPRNMWADWLFIYDTTTQDERGRGYKMRLINGRVYVHISYIIKEMGKTVDVDKNFNVRIAG